MERDYFGGILKFRSIVTNLDKKSEENNQSTFKHQKINTKRTPIHF